ncbi:MAG: hypothetical protein LBQ54_02210 [Planctomycetaceae bacterium]|jgi:hypothetical protein|nr:hypothetical protein [Planctomycetaceae bacterium]
MEKMMLGIAISVYGGAAIVSRWLISHEAALPLGQAGGIETGFVQKILDYGLSGGILVGAYFIARYLIDRIGDRLETQIKTTETGIRSDITELKNTENEIKNIVERWKE